MTLPIFPVHLFNPGTVRVGVKQNVIDGGTAINGEQTVIATDGGGRWEIMFSDISISNPRIERYYRQWTSFLAGGAGICLVPLLSLKTAPRPALGRSPMRVSELYTNDTVFPTETRFASPYIVAETVGSVALRATSIVIDVTRGSRIVGGETFGIGERAHIIERVTAISGQQATCTISPPTREAIADAATVNFEWPYVKCRAVIGQDSAPELSFGYGRVSFSFVEDFS